MAENSAAQPRKSPGRPFKKGQSGNPGGRPQELKDVQALARQHTPDAIERLAHWMRSDNAKASVAAAQALLDRGWGKPSQHMTLDAKLTLEQLVLGAQREVDVVAQDVIRH